MSNSPFETEDRSGENPPLSEAGRARREAMLPVLERAMAGRIRQRRTIRAGAGLAVVVLAGFVLTRSWPTTPGMPRVQPPIAAVNPAPGIEPPLGMQYASFHVVETQPGISAIVEVDDEKLLKELRELGHPTGLIRTRGEVILTADIGLEPTGQAPGGI